MNFDNEKRQCLEKIDNSKKQSVDSGIRKIVDLLNSHENYYTTSSCSGRVMLIEKPENCAKQDACWIYSSHDSADFCGIKKALEHPSKDDVWLMQESAILHACCRTLEDAQKLLSIARETGLKRSGMITFHNRVMVEIMSTEKIETIAAKGGKAVVDDAYLKILAEAANKGLEKNRKRIEELYRNLKKL